MASQKHPIQIERDEHDDVNYAKRVNMVSATTIYAVTNTVISIATADIQIGAVEIKDGSTDTRATVGATGLHVAVQSLPVSSVTVLNTINSITTIAPRTDYIGLMSVSGNTNLMIGGVAVSASNPVAVQPPASGSLAVKAVAGVDQIGSVTVSNVVNSVVTISPRTDYIGLVSISGNVVNAAGVNQIGSVTISNVVNSIVTVSPRTDYLGLMSISGNVVNSTGSNFIGLVTATISNATLYAVVNTSAGGQASVVLDTGTKFIGLVTATIGAGNATLFAVVNTAAAGQASVVLDAGIRQIGSVTISHAVTLGVGTATIGIVQVANQPALVAGTAYIGLVSVSGNVVNSAGANYIGLASVNIGGTLPALSVGTATIGIVRMTPLIAGTAYIGLVSVSGTVGNAAGVNQIGSVTVSSIGIGTATIGIVTANSNLLTGTNFIGLVTNVPGTTYSYYKQASLISGFIYHGFAQPGSNPTTAVFRLMREGLDKGEVLFGSGVQTFVHQWSAASLGSITYL